MNVTEITAARLHERAAHCRDLARGARSAGIAAELRSIADDYDRDAVRLEQHGVMRFPRDKDIANG